VPTRSKIIIADGIHTLVTRILKACLVALLGIITARALGPAARGIYVLPNIEASFMMTMCSGLLGATTYFVIKNNLKRLPDSAFGAALVFSFAGGLVTYAIALLSHQLWAALPAILAVFAGSAGSVANGFWYGMHRVRSVNAFAIVSSLVSLAIIGGTLFFVRDPHIAVNAWVASSLLTGVGALAFIVLRYRGVASDGASFAEFIPFTLKMGATALVSLLNYRIDVYVVALMTSPLGLGLYTIAVTGAESLSTLTQVAGAVTLPHIGSLDNRASIQLTVRACRANFAITIALCVVGVLVAPVAVRGLFGAAFGPAVPALRVLLVGALGMSTASVISSYFSIHLGRPYLTLLMAGISAVICLLISVALIPRIGIVGGAIGTASSYLATQTIALLYFSRLTGVPLAQIYWLQKDDIAAYTAMARETWLRLRSKR